MKEISLRPYHGKLFVAFSRKDYEQSHKKIFKGPDILSCDLSGKFYGGEGKDKMWTYLIWAQDKPRLAHEVCHVVLHVFERCGIDPISGGGEPFCYMVSQILLEAKK